MYVLRNLNLIIVGERIGAGGLATFGGGRYFCRLWHMDNGVCNDKKEYVLVVSVTHLIGQSTNAIL